MLFEGCGKVCYEDELEGHQSIAQTYHQERPPWNPGLWLPVLVPSNGFHQTRGLVGFWEDVDDFAGVVLI